MLWSDFGPYVLPYVIGAPEPLMQMHVRLAAIEFCRRTLCDIRTLEAVTTDGQSPQVDLVADSGTQIIKIKAVEVGGKEWTLTDARIGLSHVRSQSPKAFAFTENNAVLSVYPLQVAGVNVVVDAALAPTLTAASINDTVGTQYAQDIAHGAIASIKRITSQPYSDPSGARDEMALFYGRISTTAAKIARGVANTKMRSHTGFL